MNPFYDLNKRLTSIGADQKQQLSEGKPVATKSPVQLSLEQSLGQDLRGLMEDKSLSQAAKTVKKGALHKQEGIPADKKIGDKKLNSLKKSGTPLKKKRANFALNIQGKGKKSVKENVGMEECMECMMGECDMHGMNEAAPQGGFKKGDKVIANGAPAIVYNIDVPNNTAYVQYEADLKKGSPQTQAVVLNQLKSAAAPTSSFKKGDKVIANGAPAIVYNIDVPNNTAYVQYEADLAKGSPQTAAVVLNQLKPAVQEGYGDISELSNKTLNKVDGYKSKAQQDLKRLKKMPVDDFVNNMRQGHRIGDAANMAVQNNLKAIKQAKNRENGLDRVNTRSNKEYAEGATPEQLDKLKRLQMDRAAATRKNSRAVQQQPPQSGPRRSEVPAFIRKGRGDPGLDHTDLEETNMYSESDKDILAYLKNKLGHTGSNAKSMSRPYNGSADAHDAYNGMEFEENDEHPRHDISKSPAGGTVYTRKYDADTGINHGVSSDDSSSGPRKRGRPAGSKSGTSGARMKGSHVSQSKMNARKKDMEF